MTQPSALHQPVMLAEAITGLQVQPGNWYIDGTFGRGGHTGAILAQGGNVVAFDVDHQAIEYGQQQFKDDISAGRLVLVRENFDHAAEVVTKLQQADTIGPIAGVLFDFGTSVDQLTDKNRGFSFDSDAELDMRMDDRLGVKAKDLLALLDVRQLANLFQDFGGEEQAMSIAKAIVKEREKSPIQTTKQLADLISRIKRRQGKLHPATKVFQALRIAVNTELDSITAALPQAFELLDHGRIVTIAFHEGEDRIVKLYFKQLEEQGLGTTQDVQKPTEVEINNNPKARSAKLRILAKK